MKLTYGAGAASNWVSTATDWKGRSFTFNYTGTPLRLTSIVDSSNRSITLGYATTYNSQGDLISATDAESKTCNYNYDTNHQVIATFNALSQLVASNIFDSFGHVTTQYTQGDVNKMWQYYWSGWQTISQDPTGAKQRYFFDDKTRLIGQMDALGNMSQIFFDGQDHVVMTVSPMNETNQYIYDGKHNLVQTVDPLNFTNQFVYDAQNNLIRSMDARGNTNRFGYNAQFSMTGSTNGAGDWTTYTFNSDGTLATKVDLGGTISYGYDNFGLLKTLTYPGSLGVEGFLNSGLGDVLSHTNARGFVTSFKYDNRRQLTNTIAPSRAGLSVVTVPAFGQWEETGNGFALGGFHARHGIAIGLAVFATVTFLGFVPFAALRHFHQRRGFDVRESSFNCISPGGASMYCSPCFPLRSTLTRRPAPGTLPLGFRARRTFHTENPAPWLKSKKQIESKRQTTNFGLAMSFVGSAESYRVPRRLHLFP